MLKKCGEPNAAGYAQLKIRWKSPLATSSLRGSVSRIGFSFASTRSMATSQEISFQPGSSPALHGPPRPRRQFALTPRQREVLALLGSGRTATEIARQLGISVATARNHLHAIRAELGCSSQVEAAALARDAGLA